MRQIEIPYVEERGRRYRFFEMLPGLISWTLLILPFVMSQISPRITVFFIIGYLLLWFVKAIGLNVRSVQGFRNLHQHQKLPWGQLLEELRTGKVSQPDRHVPDLRRTPSSPDRITSATNSFSSFDVATATSLSDKTVFARGDSFWKRAIPRKAGIPTWHYENVLRIQQEPTPIKVDDIVQAIIIATYNESREVLEPTIQSVIASDYDMKNVILVLAYEERGGPEVEAQAQALMADYKHTFKHAFAVKHPKDMPGEVIGKGGNITYAARELEKYLETEKIEPLGVIVTTLDSDNRPHKHYLSALTYLYAITPNPLVVSYQPIPMFTNNIWDAPAPMRVIATGNSFWNVVISIRPHMIRNFSSHAQSMQALIDTDYWSVRTIVEDGHQFWRTYFRYDGNHEVYPIYLPIYQDAVLSTTYWRTIKAQFLQIRRWAWGASDVAYVAEKGYFTNNRVPKLDLTFKFLRLLEGHVSWATAPLILAFAAFIPLLFNPQDYGANQLPQIASRIQTVALGGIVITLFLSLKLLPPRPKRYKRHRNIWMVLQFVLLPVTTILFNGLAALYSQTRLMFGNYIGKFDVTDKVVITEDKQKVI